MRRTRALLVALALTLSACGQAPPRPSPVPTPTAAVSQQHVCGNLPADLCREAIVRVVAHAPAMADSPLAVAATRDPDALHGLGGDLVMLVAFAPVGGGDLAFNPPTWIVTERMLAAGWSIEPWRSGPLPAHFVAMLQAAGIAAQFRPGPDPRGEPVDRRDGIDLSFVSWV